MEYINKESLTKFGNEALSRALQRIDSQIASRIRRSRHATNHSSHNDFLFYKFWDTNQTDVLTPKHFNYTIGYNPRLLNGNPKPLYVHFWANLQRIPRDREGLTSYLAQSLDIAHPHGFELVHERRGPRQSNLKLDCFFDPIYPEEKLISFLEIRIHYLLSICHPLLMPLFDSYLEVLSDEARREYLLHPKEVSPAANRDQRDALEEYSRSISPNRRALIYKKHNGLCAICGTAIENGWHIDHIVPFSRGGSSKTENLQLTCGPCNLKKGNRI